MTQREREILALIEHNPMISQQELADALRITRSSVAVHISNLQKKVHRLRLISLVLAVGFILAVALLVQSSLASDPPEPTGRNYTIQTS